jgi:pimeloyl-ACP methyl ester carboxylesterase
MIGGASVHPLNPRLATTTIRSLLTSKTLVEHLHLSEIILVGFSMGSGEVVRYLSSYGSSRVAKAVLVGAIPPFLKT